MWNTTPETNPITGETAIYFYEIMFCDYESGQVLFDVLVGTDDGHAYEEATYECPGEIIRVKRESFAYF